MTSADRSATGDQATPGGGPRSGRQRRLERSWDRTERRALGKAERRRVPLDAHRELAASGPDADPILLLERQAVSRVPELVPVRYGRMLLSPFTFYRGGALIMAADLDLGPSTGLHAQLCGDAHLSNFGVFASPERDLVFDINDFDETLPGPFEWDVKRLAASLEIAARDSGFNRKERQRVVRRSARAYRETMRDFAGKGNLAVWYAHIREQEIMPYLSKSLASKRLRVTEETLAKARTRDSLQALRKLTTVVGDRVSFISDPPLIVPLGELLPEHDARELTAWLEGLLAAYARTLDSDLRHLLRGYRLVDVARKVVGVGSVGTRAWIVLLQGIDGRDPLILQAKEAQPSVLEEYAGASRYANSAHRVVAGQRLMQAHGDILLGWQRTRPLDGGTRDYYVRQLRDWKGSIVVEEMPPQSLEVYGQLCAWTLARAHARSGDRVAIDAYLGTTDTFDRAVVDFASAYADKNEQDHALMRAAAASGRIKPMMGV